MYVYKQTDSNPDLFTVGFYTPDGEWEPESDHSNSYSAADRVAYLNGVGKKTEGCNGCNGGKDNDR